MRARRTALVLLALAVLGACSRTGLELETELEPPPDAGASPDVGAPSADGAADSAARDAGPLDLSCPVGGLQAHAPWPTWRRCSGRTASTPVVGPQTAPTLVWNRTATPGLSGVGAWSDLVIATDGTIYAADQVAGLVAFTPTGSTKWTAPLAVGSTYTTSLAIRSDGTVYVTWGVGIGLLGSSTAIYAVSPDGGVAWSTQGVDVSEGMAVASDGTIETLGYDPHNYLVFGSVGPDGTTLATFGGFDGGFGLIGDPLPPALGPGGDLYAIAGTTSTMAPPAVAVAFTPRGTIDWTVPATSLPMATVDFEYHGPIVRDDGSVVFSDPGGVHAITSDGAPLWTVTGIFGVLAAGPDGTVYVSTALGCVASIQYPQEIVAIRADGKIAWRLGTGMGNSCSHYSLIVDGRGTVYAAAPAGIVAIGSDGTQLWEWRSGGEPIAIDGAGTLYAISGSDVVALR